MQQTVQDWARNTSGTPLYAVLANTNGAQGIKAYYREDGSRTPYGLYANTPYANWFEVMPVLVPLTDGSPFLRWVAETPLRNWGWLARSPLPQVDLAAHLAGLTQVIMPGGKAVFSATGMANICRVIWIITATTGAMFCRCSPITGFNDSSLHLSGYPRCTGSGIPLVAGPARGTGCVAG